MGTTTALGLTFVLSAFLAIGLIGIFLAAVIAWIQIKALNTGHTNKLMVFNLSIGKI